MEELRIKCPSCGIILDVRNSKNEAVKRIVCPHCKKQLAVTFREEAQPAQFVEIKMVQLSDGSTKTIIRVLTEGHEVKVNGSPLLKDDEVVLSPGDRLEVDGKDVTPTTPLLRQTQKTAQKTETETPQPRQTQTVDQPAPEVKSRNYLPYYAAAVVVILLLAIVLWKQSSRQQVPASVRYEVSDTMKGRDYRHSTDKKPASQLRQEQRQKKDKEPQPTEAGSTDITSLNNYELEKLAMSGHVEAQYQLGRRWVNLHDSINVVKGIKYLKLAARNGSAEARQALQNVFTALQQSAANGSSTAGNILREQR